MREGAGRPRLPWRLGRRSVAHQVPIPHPTIHHADKDLATGAGTRFSCAVTARRWASERESCSCASMARRFSGRPLHQAGLRRICVGNGDALRCATLVAVGVLGRCWAIVHIGGRKNVELIRSGPYRHSRNPLYLFSIFACSGFGVMSQSFVLAATLALSSLVTFYTKIRDEERYLSREFGDAYSAYATRTPRLWPRPGAAGPGPADVRDRCRIGKSSTPSGCSCHPACPRGRDGPGLAASGGAGTALGNPTGAERSSARLLRFRAENQTDTLPPIALTRIAAEPIVQVHNGPAGSDTRGRPFLAAQLRAPLRSRAR